MFVIKVTHNQGYSCLQENQKIFFTFIYVYSILRNILCDLRDCGHVPLDLEQFLRK